MKIRPKSPPRWVETTLLDPCSDSSVQVECKMPHVSEGKECKDNNQDCSKPRLSNLDDVVRTVASEKKRLRKFKKNRRQGDTDQINYTIKMEDKVVDGQVLIVSRLCRCKTNSTKRQRGKVRGSGCLAANTRVKDIGGELPRTAEDCVDGGDRTLTNLALHDSKGTAFNSPVSFRRSRSCEFLTKRVKAASISWPCLRRRTNKCSVNASQREVLVDCEGWTGNVSVFNCCLSKCCNCPPPDTFPPPGTFPPPDTCPCCPPVDCTCANKWRTFSFNCTPSNHLTGCARPGPLVFPPDCRNLNTQLSCNSSLRRHGNCQDSGQDCQECPPIPCPIQRPVVQGSPGPPRPPPVPPPPVPEKRPPPRPPKRKQPPPPPSRPPSQPPLPNPPPPPPPPIQPGHPPFYPPPEYHPPPPPVGPPFPPCPPPCCIPCCIPCCPPGRPSRGKLNNPWARHSRQPSAGNRQIMICCSPMCCPPCRGSVPPGKRKRKLKAK